MSMKYFLCDKHKTDRELVLEIIFQKYIVKFAAMPYIKIKHSN